MRWTFFAALILFAQNFASGAEPDAKALSQEILNKGSTLFDRREAGAMAATYRDNAEIHLISRSKVSGEVKTEVKHGRAEIESEYAEIFKDRKPGTKSRNRVEFATLLAPDVLVIHGKFQLDVEEDLAIAFMQMRVKVEGQWLIQRIDMFFIED